LIDSNRNYQPQKQSANERATVSTNNSNLREAAATNMNQAYV